MKLPKINLTKKQTTLLALFIITILLASLLIYLSSKNQQQGPSPETSIIQIKQAQYQDIKPGESKLSEVEEKLGQPISSVITSTGTTYQFESGNQYLPHEVIIDSEDTVQFINRPLVEIPKENQITKYTQELKEQPIKLYNQASLSGVNLYVFPKHGIAIEATEKSGLGLNIKYFPPSDDINMIMDKYFPSYSKIFDPEKYHD